MKQIKWYLLSLLLFALIGFVRDFFFVNLNNILYILYYKHETSMPVPSSMQFLMNYSYDGLYYSKYIYTLLFVIFYFTASYFTIIKLRISVYFIIILKWTYLLLLILAALSMLYGYFIHGNLDKDEYTLSRWLLGIAQSPIVCLILLASAKLYPGNSDLGQKN